MSIRGSTVVSFIQKKEKKAVGKDNHTLRFNKVNFEQDNKCSCCIRNVTKTEYINLYLLCKSFTATTLPSLKSTLSSFGLKNTSTFGISFRIPLCTFPNAPLPSSSIIVTRSGEISFNSRGTMSDFDLQNCCRDFFFLFVKISNILVYIKH